MTAPKIRLYVDIVSPFAYIAFYVLRTSPIFAKCSITYVPILLGGLMKQCNNEAPINIKNKDKWIYKERIRLARRFSVPMATSYPEGFPPKTVNIQRALCAISQRFPEKLEAAIDALYRTLWAENNGKIGQVEVLKPLLDDLLGVNNSQQILDVATLSETKSLLLSNTTTAFTSGAFGLPWLECTNSNNETETFWGVDHLGLVADFLGLGRNSDEGFRAFL